MYFKNYTRGLREYANHVVGCKKMFSLSIGNLIKDEGVFTRR